MFDHRGAGGAARQDWKIPSFQQIFVEGAREKNTPYVCLVAHFGALTHCVCVFRAVRQLQPKIKSQINYMSLQSSLSSEIDLIDDSDEEQEVF